MASVHWMKSGNGNWNTPSAWSDGTLPAAGDDVSISGSLTVTHSTGSDTIRTLATNMAALALSGGTLTVRNFASFGGSYSQSGGTLVLGGAGGDTGGSFKETGGSIVLRSGTFNLAGPANIASTITGGGELEVSNDTTVLGSGAHITTARFAVAGGELKLTANQAYAGAFDLSAGTLSLNNKTFTLSGSTALDGGVISGPGTVVANGGASLDGISTSGAATLTLGGESQIVGVSLDNNSVLSIKGVADDTGNITLGASVGSNAKLNVLASGTLQLLGDAGILGNSSASMLTVSGTLVHTGGSGLAEINSTTVNNGVIEAKSGDMQFLAGVSGNGTFRIDGSALLGFESRIGGGTTVSFAADTGLLRLGHATPHFDATIANFHGGDEVQLSDFNADTARILGFSGGILTVTDGMQTAKLAFSGAGLSAASFRVDYAQVGAGIFHT